MQKFVLFLLNKENQLAFSKLTSVLPVNKEALADKYFQEYEQNNLNSKARFYSSQQLNNVQEPVYFAKNKSDIINKINETTQSILLDKMSIDEGLEKTSAIWRKLEE